MSPPPEGPRPGDKQDAAALTDQNQPTATGQLAATPASSLPTATTPAAPTAAVSTQLAQQVSQYLMGTQTLRDGTHRAVIKLSPENLGEVTVTMDVKGNSVRMHLIAGPEAIGALRNDLHGLRDQLAQSGLKLDDVSLAQSGPGGADNRRLERPGNLARQRQYQQLRDRRQRRQRLRCTTGRNHRTGRLSSSGRHRRRSTRPADLNQRTGPKPNQVQSKGSSS